MYGWIGVLAVSILTTIEYLRSLVHISNVVECRNLSLKWMFADCFSILSIQVLNSLLP